MGDFEKVKKRDIKAIKEIANNLEIAEKEISATSLSDLDCEHIIYILELIKNCYRVNDSLKEVTDEVINNIVNYENTYNNEPDNLVPLSEREFNELLDRLDILRIENYIYKLNFDIKNNHQFYLTNYYLHYVDNLIILLFPLLGAIKALEAIESRDIAGYFGVFLLSLIGETIGFLKRLDNMINLCDIEDEFDDIVDNLFYYVDEYNEKIKTFGPRPIYYGYENKIN